MDPDLDTMSREQLVAEVRKLRDGIRKHRDSTEHELCWHHPKLWGLLPEKSDPVPTVPLWPQFMTGCIRYRASLDSQIPNAPRTSKPYADVFGRRVDTFFYGLFMDAAILRASGVSEPANPRRAFVDSFELRIGQRATLVPESGARAYGMLFALNHAELDLLYAAPGLEAYRAEAILAQPFDGSVTPALCYNLRDPPLADEWNQGYASRLQGVLADLGFPREYVAAISKPGG